VEKYRKGSGGFQEERQYLTPDEIRLLINHAHEQLRLFMMAAVMTGMREGDLFGLKWEDVDWNAKQIYV
jgi:integrase